MLVSASVDRLRRPSAPGGPAIGSATRFCTRPPNQQLVARVAAQRRSEASPERSLFWGSPESEG